MRLIRCFWLETTDRVRRGLRRYRSIERPGARCRGPRGYHNAVTPLDVLRAVFDQRNGRRLLSGELSCIEDELEADDWRWPKRCDDCNYVFADDDPRQVSLELTYRRADTGGLLTLDEAPPGAMWDAWWLNTEWLGPDGVCLVVRTPAGDWVVDGECANCADRPRPHRRARGQKTHLGRPQTCWTRRGDPRSGLVSVDRHGGPTWAGGDGSLPIRAS